MPGTTDKPADKSVAKPVVQTEPVAPVEEEVAEPYYPDPKGEPGVAEEAEAQAKAAKEQQQEALRAQADALDAEPVVDLNEDAGAPVTPAPEEETAKAKAKP